MSNVVALLVGFVFSLGLGIGGMTQPAKVVGFLDFFGDWDPSLAFVMGGAVITHFALYRFIVRRPTPLFSARFSIPEIKTIDARLVVGSALFGIGWGLGGICPGPGLAAVASGAAPFVAFILAMLAGMAGFSVFNRLQGRN